MDPFIVGIRFQKVGKVYHFDAANCRDIQVGDFAIVETSRGRQLGEIIQIVENPAPPPEGSWKPIYRKATPRESGLKADLAEERAGGDDHLPRQAGRSGHPRRQDRRRRVHLRWRPPFIVIQHKSEGKVDLRKLNNVMQRLYPRSRVEMRQVGPAMWPSHWVGWVLAVWITAVVRCS